MNKETSDISDDSCFNHTPLTADSERAKNDYEPSVLSADQFLCDWDRPSEPSLAEVLVTGQPDSGDPGPGAGPKESTQIKSYGSNPKLNVLFLSAKYPNTGGGGLKVDGHRTNRIPSTMINRMGGHAKKLPYKMLSDNIGYELTEEISWRDVQKLKLPPVNVSNGTARFDTDVDEERAARAKDQQASKDGVQSFGHCPPTHPVMTDRTEHVILSDDEEEEKERLLSSPRKLTRAAQRSLKQYLKAKHERVRQSRGHPRSLTHVAPPEFKCSPHNLPTPTGDMAFYRWEPQHTPSKFLFLHRKTSAQTIKDKPITPRKHDDPGDCTCADDLPRCKSTRVHTPNVQVGTVRSWCVPLSHEQKYRLDLLHKDRPTIPPLQTHVLDTRHSRTRMRRIERHKKINDSIPPCSHETHLLKEKLDAFFENKLLPKMKNEHQVRTPVKLKQSRGKTIQIVEDPVKIARGVTLPIQKPETLFPEPESTEEFAANLLKALDQFVVRKEQITIEEGWQTITTITFNRRLHLNYGNANDISKGEESVRGEGDYDILTLHV